MMNRICIFLFLVINFHSCTPSLQQIKLYEFSEQIKEQGVFVMLQNNDEDIELYREYGQQNKADKLEQQTIEVNEKFKQAISDNYTFSSVRFCLDSQPPSNDNFQLKVTIEEDHREDNQSYRQTASIIDLNGTHPTIAVQRTVNSANTDQRFIIKQLSNKLERLIEKAR